MARKPELDDYELIIESEGKDSEVERPMLDLTNTAASYSDTDSSDWELDRDVTEEVSFNVTRESPLSFDEADANVEEAAPFQEKDVYENELFDDSMFSEVDSTEEVENTFDDLTDEEIEVLMR